MKKILAAMTAALLISALGSSAVFAAKATSTWKLYSFNTSGHSLRSQTAAVTNGAVRFTFPTTSDAAYLTSTTIPASASGTAPYLSATVSISAVGGTTFANYPGCTSSTTTPTVGLYFETKSAGGFNPSTYWWSSERHAVDAALSTGLTTYLTAGSWTNYNGQTDPTGFASAASNITSWGVSFGGDCFYANGVGTPIGSAVFTLQP